MWGIAALTTALFGTSACNLLTGAEGLEFEESGGGGEDGAGSPSTTVDPAGGTPAGAGGAGAGHGGAGVGGAGGSRQMGGAGGGGVGPASSGSGVTCGDGACNGAETCGSCPGDCGPCESCGDGACNAGETCESCQGDCGQCDPCGNGTCDAGETCEACASDCGACSKCEGSGDATTPLDGEEAAFLVILNEYRASNGLGALTACTSLNRAAQGHSEDMRDQNYFSHSGLDGSSPWGRSCDACYEQGCGPSTAMAENIAAGNAGAQATFTQWKSSPGHNSNMLGGNFTMIGIGRATGGGQYGSYWTNVFGGDSEGSCN